MVLRSREISKKTAYVLAAPAYALVICLGLAAVAQAQAPLPGGGGGLAPGAPAGQASAGSPATTSAPLPGQGAPAQAASTSRYQQLPLSPYDAQARLDELKSLLPQGDPRSLQESIYELCDWLTDMASAHYKLAGSFAKSDATHAQAEAERQAGSKFSHFKNQALLLKADLLIKQHRYPEALSPLVDIVIQEPRSQTGQAAYNRLKEIGFAQEVPAPAQPVAEAQADKPPSPAATLPSQCQIPKAQRAQAAPRPSGNATRAQTSPPADSQPPKGTTVWISGSPYGSPAGSHAPKPRH